VNEELAVRIGKELSAHYVLFGSVTVFGNSVSVDGRMVDVSGAAAPVTVFSQSQGMDEVIPRINLFAEEINEKVFGRETAVRPLAKEEPAKQDAYRAHPERLLTQRPQEDARGQREGAPAIVARSGGRITGFWKSQSFPMRIEGLAMGDVDGDGKTETVLLSRRKIVIGRFEDGRFQKIVEMEGKRYEQYISVDVADMNGNGRAEIFVTCLGSGNGSLESFVLEWDGRAFVPLVAKQAWYYRVVTDPTVGPLLFGQKRAVIDPFAAGVWELRWSGGKYVPERQMRFPGDSVRWGNVAVVGESYTDATNVYGFAVGDIKGDGRKMLVAFGSDDRLSLLSGAGEKEWTSSDRYGGSENYLEWPSESESSNQLYLAQRVLVRDLSGDGKDEVVVVSHESVTGRFLRNYRRYDGAQFEVLSWDGLGLSSLWTTRRVSGYVSDYGLADFDNDGALELVAAVVISRGHSLKEAKSAVIAYEVDPSVWGAGREPR